MVPPAPVAPPLVLPAVVPPPKPRLPNPPPPNRLLALDVVTVTVAFWPTWTAERSLAGTLTETVYWPLVIS